MRRGYVAGSFYPDEQSQCRNLIEKCLRDASLGGPPERSSSAAAVRAGIVPHAGWVFSGPTACHVFRALPHRDDLRVVIFGAVHYPGVTRPVLYPEGQWWTPLGPVDVDAELAGEIRAAADDLLEVDPDKHAEEHSIEVQIPFLRYLFPDARIVPVLVPPTEDAVDVGARIGKVLQGRDDVVLLGSTDLTHYGPRYRFQPQGAGEDARNWVTEVNDQAMLDLIVAASAGEVIPEYRRSQNACGPGAVAATLAAARTLGATSGRVLDYTVSCDVQPRYGMENFVGYVGAALP